MTTDYVQGNNWVDIFPRSRFVRYSYLFMFVRYLSQYVDALNRNMTVNISLILMFSSDM